MSMALQNAKIVGA